MPDTQQPKSHVRLEWAIPLLYALGSGTWIWFSDTLVAAVADSPAEQAAWGTAKGFGFILVTAVLLHAGLRWALARERRAHEVVKEQLALKEQLASIADTVPGLICSFELRPDGSACMPFTTPAAVDLFGLSQESLARSMEEWADHVHPDDYGPLMAGIARIAGTPERWHDQYRYLHPTKGLRWIEGWSIPIDDAAGRKVWHGFVMDVTDRKRSEQTLRETEERFRAEQRRLEEQLQQSQRLESIGRLAGGVAHDFNNLLTVVLCCAEALKEDLREGRPANPEDADEIAAAGVRARDLTQQLLAFARKQVIAPVALDLNSHVESWRKLLRRVLGDDIELVIDLHPGLWPVYCDPGQLEQVILNLAVNARDAMPRGGTLTLRTLNEPGAEGNGAGQPGVDRVKLIVGDTGVGMDAQTRAHLFEPFFTTKPRGQGTGLGLATVYGIVKQSDGTVTVESQPGGGTTFEIAFPRAAEMVGAGASAPASAPRTTRGTETILVVEDNAAVRDVAVRSLASAGYRVLAAETGNEALQLAGREKEAVQLLLTDVIMPGMDGPAVAAALRRAHPTLRVLFMSGYTQDAVVQRGTLQPGIDFLPKPFTAAVLLDRVRRALDGGGARN